MRTTSCVIHHDRLPDRAFPIGHEQVQQQDTTAQYIATSSSHALHYAEHHDQHSIHLSKLFHIDQPIPSKQ